jgi:hypothetical protein
MVVPKVETFSSDELLKGDLMTAKIIDMTSRRRAQLEKEEKTMPKFAGEVVNMEEKRSTLVRKERRSHTRSILTEFLGAYIVVPEKGLQKVLVYDLSEKGVSFDLEMDAGKLREGEEVALRIYLSQTTYFPVVVQVTNIRAEEDEGVYRHGASFVKSLINQEALHHFVKFIEAAGFSLKLDTGDLVSSRY